MSAKKLSFTVKDVREMARRFSNWGRWWKDDELGTVNFITPEKVCAAAALVRTGRSSAWRSRSTRNGLQTGYAGRVSPIHCMMRDGGDVVSGARLDPDARYTDDAIVMPLQRAT
jgi:hypothetical protein